VTLTSWRNCSDPPGGKIIFEGAQGLLLDEDHRFFPHVTHSHTGLNNVMQLVVEDGIEEMDVTYVTRSYATRHGAGPFPREVAGLSYKDETNVPNDWQGSIRFGELDVDLLAESIRDDARHATIPIRRGLAITCLNQTGSDFSYWLDGQRKTESWPEAIKTIAKRVEAGMLYAGLGPTAEDIVAGEVF
jgi:adenylosuccinate synthase